jgi:Kef-type K+ transport system membrane component KefB
MTLEHFGSQLLGRIHDGPTLAFFILTLLLIIGPRFATALRLPAMVGLVLAGMAVGPHGFGLLASKKIALSALGDFGLLYLMFAAGLELDLKRFLSMKRAALIFASLSFIIPFTLGLVSAKFLGFATAAAVLMGSNWGSHTLVTYPMLRGMGLGRNPAVGTVVGATAVTDTTALLVLAGVSASVAKSESFTMMGAEIAVGLVLLGVWTLFVLPRLGRWFFGRVGTDRAFRFVFALAGFLSGAVLAMAAGIDGIVGAFFAGLGLNRAIPEESPLMERVQFFGSALFIPIFLVSVGVLLDPKVMIDPKTLLIALVFTIAVLGGKALAAVLAGRLSHFSWPEIGTMAGLSGSQAAATLATTLVGAKLGLFNEQTINAVLVVILASLVVTPAMVTFFGKRITGTGGKEEALGRAVLVPIYSEATKPLLAVAAKLAAPDSGIVMPGTFAADNATDEVLAQRRKLKEQAEEWVARQGLESRSVFRLSHSLESGLFETVRSEHVSLLLGEWHFEGLDPESEASRLMAQSPVPVLLVRGEVEPFKRLLVVARRQEIAGPGRRDLEIAAQLAGRLAADRGIGYVGAPASPIKLLFAQKLQVNRFDTDDPFAWIKEHAQPGDRLMFCGVGAAREALSRMPGLDRQPFLVACAAHVAVPVESEEAAGAVIGRSATQLRPT